MKFAELRGSFETCAIEGGAAEKLREAESMSLRTMCTTAIAVIERQIRKARERRGATKVVISETPTAL
jgi:hypothetical protein